MQFTGKSLARVRQAIDLAIAELHNQIATCPDVIKYEEDIEELELEQLAMQRLAARIDKSIEGKTK